MQLRLLGGLQAVADDRPVDLGSPKQRMVLAVLALAAPHPVRPDRLIELLWEDHDPDKALVGLQSYISNLRRILDRSVLVREVGGYRLTCAVDLVDLEAMAALPSKTPDAARDVLLQSTAPPLPEFADHPVVVEATDRWRRALAVVLETVAAHDLAQGRATEAAAAVEPLLGQFPRHERLHVVAATAAYRSGRQSDALKILDDLCRELRDEAGLEPSADVRALQQAILDHDEQIAAPAERTPFVGRTQELAAIERAAHEAAAGSGGIIVVSGEPGVGKSTLVARAIDQLPETFATATVRCPASATPAFWALHRLRDTATDHGGDPFLLAEAFADEYARSSPTVLVLDDLQWADADTLRVVAHLTSTLRSTSCLLVAVTRPLASDASTELVSCLAELTRHGRGEVALRGLDPDDIERWAASVLDDPAGDLADRIHERSGGNALFARELLQLVADDRGARDGLTADEPDQVRRFVPTGVRAVVRQRVERMPPATQRLLSSISALGDEVRIDALADMLETSSHELVRTLTPAVDDDIIEVDVETVRFGHALVRDALQTEISADRMAAVNASFARTLDRRADRDDVCSLIAQHAALGAMAGSGDLAASAASRAARLATDHGAHREATRLWQLAAAHLHEPTERRTATLEAAQSAAVADDVHTATTQVSSVLASAMADDDVVTAVAAAGVLDRPSIFPNHPYGVVDERLVEQLRRLHARLDPSHHADRAVVAAAITTELANGLDPGERSRWSLEAVADARCCDDAGILGRALHARTFALKDPAGVPERLAVAEELIDLAETDALATDLAMIAELQAALAEFGLGRFEPLDARVRRCLALASRPVGDAARSQLTYFRAHLAFVRGSHAEAAVLAEEAHRRTLISRPAEAPGLHLAFQLMVQFDAGSVDDGLLDAVAAIPATSGYARPLRMYTGAILFEHGRTGDATALVSGLRSAGPPPDDYLTLFVDTVAAAVAVELGDVDEARRLIDRLAPWRGRWAYAGTAAGSVGLVDLALARCEALAGDAVAAQADFECAVREHRRIGAQSWLRRSLRHQEAFLESSA